MGEGFCTSLQVTLHTYCAERAPRGQCLWAMSDRMIIHTRVPRLLGFDSVRLTTHKLLTAYYMD